MKFSLLKTNKYIFSIFSISFSLLLAGSLFESVRGQANSSSIYRELETFLSQKKWKEADQKTYQLLLVLSGSSPTQEFWSASSPAISLENVALEKIPCSDLKKIDFLWQKYSSNQFGMSVQKPIYEQKLATSMLRNRLDTDLFFDPVGLFAWLTQVNVEAEELFGEQVGWKNDEQWLKYSQITEMKEAPIGHFPCLTCYGIWAGWISGYIPEDTITSTVFPFYLFSKMERCDL